MRCGLLGQTLKHSYSPAIHEALCSDYSYELFEIEPENLAAFLQSDTFHGINVTIPYKTAVIPFCKTLSPTAKAIGSVNTIVRQSDGSLHGDNTDAAGFAAMLQQSGISVSGKRVLVFGGGGSSLTICHVLAEQNAAQVDIIETPEENTAENLSCCRDAAVIVNTTPVGMYPDTDNAVVDIANFPHLDGILDIIYNPARTQLLQAASKRGIPHLGGLSMLVGQAKAAAECFVGYSIDNTAAQNVLQQMRREMENLILIGMPGCGKSTIGKLAAARLGRTFIDVDYEIESSSGIAIPEIFAQEGEAGFRRRETDILAKFSKESGLVIATGGGVVTRPENEFHLRQNGRLIYLEREISQLARAGRPLSTGANLDEMYAKRHPLYLAFADQEITNDKDPAQIAGEVLEAFYEVARH